METVLELAEAVRLELAKLVCLIVFAGDWNTKLFFALGLAGEEQVVAMEGRFIELLILMVEFARSDCRLLLRIGLVGGVPLPDLLKAITAWGQIACMLLLQIGIIAWQVKTLQ